MRLRLDETSNVWFTSDLHFNHRNICQGVSNWDRTQNTRPFETLEEMDQALVNGINHRVRAEDVLFFLGDWSFGGAEKVREYRQQLACNRIVFIAGNHDRQVLNKHNDLRSLFLIVDKYMDLELVLPNETVHRFALSHFPIASWAGIGRGVMHLHGHSHSRPDRRFKCLGRMMDVGVDGNPEGFFPYPLCEILSLLGSRPVEGLLLEDHHLDKKRRNDV